MTRKEFSAMCRQRIIDAVVPLAMNGIHSFSLRDAGKAAGCTHTNILQHFKTMHGLRCAIANHAIQSGDERLALQFKAINWQF